MKKMILAAVATLAVAGPAQAATAVGTFGGPATFASSAVGAITFNSGALNTPGYSIAGTDFDIRTGSSSTGATPFGSDGSFYLNVFGAGPSSAFATIQGSVGYDVVSFYWGSIDAFNTVELLDSAGAAIALFTGNQIPPADGNQTASNTNRLVTFTRGISESQIAGLRFSSTGNSFEIDNVRFGAAIPEPATWAMMITGFGFVGGSMRRRSSAKKFATA